MYKLFLIFIFLSTKTYGAAAFSTEHDAGASASASSKPVSATKTGAVIHETSESAPYYFRADPVTKDFIEKLKEYQAGEKELFSAYSKDVLPALSAEDRMKKAIIIEGCERVLDDLVIHASKNYFHTDTWVMSIIRKEDDAPLMRVCAKTYPRSKFTHHIGICQSFARFISDDTLKGLSLILHGFAADFMIQREPKRKSGYMITAPTDIMRYILSEFFPRHAHRAKLLDTREGLFIELNRRTKIPLEEDDSWLYHIYLRDTAVELAALQDFFSESMAATT